MQQLWPRIQALIKQQVNEQTWNKFFRHLVLHSYDADEIVFHVPDPFFVTWFENHYLDYLKDIIRKYAGRDREIRLMARSTMEGAQPMATDGAGSSLAYQGALPFDTARATGGVAAAPAPLALPALPPVNPPAPMMASSALIPGAGLSSVGQMAYTQPTPSTHEERVLRAGLNPRYTFEHFVVGGSNQFCDAACQAVADRPAQVYNPLFLFGGVGLGKTHLLHAVGNRLLRSNPHLRVTYVTSEQFMNELIHSLRNKDTNAFRTKYREQCDVLLMDDIQFIAGKDSTQEEFFHTFNALHQAHRQIIITSDKLPQELPGLEERLRSRFGWGLIADIQPPEMETRIAIIKKKAEVENITLDDDVVMFLATQIRSNVRELEGSLVRLKAYASLYKRPITLELAREQIQSVVREQSTQVTIEDIQRAVCDFYNVKVKDIVGPRRHRAIAHPRHVAMYLARQHTSLSFPEIGRQFGGRDHSTIMNAVSKVEGLATSDERLKQELRSIEKAITG